ncbi:MAG: radical SAM protein [Firmicutes bacterium]|nr:radical SAM protein [Bacillota bacterium]
MDDLMKNCTLCPRNCGADRTKSSGFCRVGDKMRVALVSTHMYEEPCISGTSGSGTVFFSGCNMACVFCQNFDISQKPFGQDISPDTLSDIFLKKQAEGVHNINLVSPSHFVPQIRETLIMAKEKGLSIPVVYNTNSYEKPETLRLLDGLVDVYLADLKYFSEEFSQKYSAAPDYFAHASEAVKEMLRQVGHLRINADGIAEKGLLVRHLVLPSLRKDSERILLWIRDNLGAETYVSVMNQYVPMYKASEFREISRRLTTFEYEKVLDYFLEIGMENGFRQGKGSAVKDYTPKFDLSGLE